MNNKNSQELSQGLLRAMDLLVNRGINKAKFDKTIPVQIISCMDKQKGVYKVKHQDAIYTASAATTDIVYAAGDEVYITVPEGNLSNEKKIIGEVAVASSTNNLKETDSLNNYRDIGESVVNSKGNEFGLSSWEWSNYENGIHDQLYLYEGGDTSDFSVDNASFAAILQEEGCDYFGIAATFRTNLAESQKGKGNYGLIVRMIFENEQGETAYDFPIDVNAMTGNPYSYINGSAQKVMYTLPGGNFKRIESILFFTNDFANKSQETDLTHDIFVSDIKITGMALSDAPYFNTYTMDLDFSAGNTFNETITSTTVTPHISYHGESISDLSDFDFFWFKENSIITTADDSYNYIGGVAWECLNNFSNNEEKEWISQNQYTISCGTYRPKQVKYKCVMVLDNESTVEKIFYINDSTPTHSIALIADNQNFKNSNGAATITCNVETLNSSVDLSNIVYCWHKVNSVGVSERLKAIDQTTNGEGASLSEDSSINNYEIVTTLHGLINLIENGYKNNYFNEETYFIQFLNFNKDVSDELDSYLGTKAFTGFLENAIKNLLNLKEEESLIGSKISYKDVLEQLNVIDNRYYITYIHDNVYYELPAKAFSTSVTYGCTAWAIDDSDNQIYLGSANILLTNTIEDTASATLNIIGGEQIFKYDSEGRSPCSSTTMNPIPQKIKPLTFTLFDEDGIQIHDAKIFDGSGSVVSDWEWRVPIENTFLEIDSALIENDSNQADGYYIIKNLKELPFTIKSIFSDTYNQNKIHLYLTYQNKIVRASTNFMFIKDGSNGTNGTEYVCKVSPNIESGIEEYPALIFNNGNSSLNFQPIEANKWFKAELWRNNELITLGSDNNLSIKWKLLTHKVNGKLTSGYYNIDEEGNCSIDTSGEMNSPAAITQAEMQYTLQDEETSSTGTTVNNKIINSTQTIYGSIPLTTIFKNNSTYEVRIKPNSGFNYVLFDADGKNPVYAYRDFEVEVFNNNNLNDNIVDSFDVSYEAYGDADLFTVKEEDKKCSVRVKEGYSGYEVNNGLKCTIKQSGQNIATIYHPIHMMLNRYGISALNGWNGNSLDVNEDGTILLAPQVGAGYKEDDNSFTGIVIGTMRESNTGAAADGFEDKTGLFGFKGGSQSIFLDAETGKAEFGAGTGKITIDPSNNEAKIYGGGYDIDNSTGLLIDLIEPAIVYGNGNFSVDGSGNLKAVNADIKGIIRATEIQMVDKNDDSEQPFDDYLDGAIEGAVQNGINNGLAEGGDIRDYIDSVVGDLGDQFDQQQITWFGEVDPTLENFPAEDWTDGATKELHKDDLYYNTNKKTCFRWTGSNWESFDNPKIAQALEDAAAAQDTADKKRRTFTGTELPIPPYDEGDLWLEGSEGDIKVCVKAKKEGDEALSSDWALASKYTNDDALEAFIEDYEEYQKSISSQLDKKAETWYQATDPVLDVDWGDPSNRVGDLWHYTGSAAIVNETYREGNSEWIWQETNPNSGTYQWQPMEVPDNVWDIADGKSTIYTSIADINEAFQSSLPPQNNDLFMPVNTEGNFKKGRIYRYNPSAFTYTVEDISGASYGFILNDNGYYESQNKGVHNSYAICRVKVVASANQTMVFEVINYAEDGWDFALFSNLDTSLELSYNADGDSGSAKVLQSFKNLSSPDVQTVTYNLTPGEHFIDVKFRKDSSNNSNNDSVQFKIIGGGGSTTSFVEADWIDTGVASMDDIQSGGDVSFDEVFEEKVLDILNNGSGTNITSEHVITPSIGGGYLSITNGTYRVVIDPEKSRTITNENGTPTTSTNQHIFSVKKVSDDKILMGVDFDGTATFDGDVTARNLIANDTGNIAGWHINSNALTSTQNLTFNDTTGFYIGTNGLRLGEALKVDTSGNLTASGTIQGSTIQGSTFSQSESVGGLFKIDEDGNISASSISIDSFVECKEILSERYPGVLTKNIYVGIDGVGSSEDTYTYEDLSDEAADPNATIKKPKFLYSSVKNFLDSIPKNLDGHTIYIQLTANITENITLQGFTGGRIIFYLGGYTLNGYFYCKYNGTRVDIYGGERWNGTRTNGTIKPAKGISINEHSSAIINNGSFPLYLNYVSVYGPTALNTGDTGRCCIVSQHNGFIDARSIGINKARVGFRAAFGGIIYVNSARGQCVEYNANTKKDEGYGYVAIYGGILTLNQTGTYRGQTATEGKNHCSGFTQNTWEGNGGILKVHGTPNYSATPSGSGNTSNDPSSDPVTVTKTITFTSDYGNSLQGNSWRSDKKPKVGNWGYGNHRAFWFFGTDFNKIANKDIKKAQITFTRLDGGNSSSTPHNFYTHSYTTQSNAGTSPSYNTSALITDLGVKTGVTKTFTITNTTKLNNLKKAKGICSIPASQDKSHYSVMSGVMKVKFTYEEEED